MNFKDFLCIASIPVARKFLPTILVAIGVLVFPAISQAGLCKENGGTSVCAPVEVSAWRYQGVFPSNMSPPPPTPDFDTELGVVEAMKQLFVTVKKCPVLSTTTRPWPTSNAEPPNNYGAIGPNYSVALGVEFQNAREMTVTYNPLLGQICDTSRVEEQLLVYRRIRDLSCPIGFGYSSIENLCIRPQVDICPQSGNPICVATGSKLATETDIAAQPDGLPGFSRYYNSGGFFAPAGTEVDTALQLSKPFGKNWRTTYSKRIWSPLMAGTTVLGIAERSNGMIRYFGTNGRPLENLGGGQDTLNKDMSGGTHAGWTYYDAMANVSERYDAAGRLISLDSDRGLKVRLTYSDGAGGQLPVGSPQCSQPTNGPGILLICATDDFGHQTNFVYDAQGRLSKAYDNAGNKYEYVYGGPTSGGSPDNLTSVIYPDNTTRIYHYAEPAYIANGTPAIVSRGLLTGITDENNSRFGIYKYDASGRAYSTEHAGGKDKHTLAYSNPGSGSTWFATVSETDPSDTVRTHTFQNSADQVRQTAKTEPCGSSGCTGMVSKSVSYDANGNVASRTDFKGNVSCSSFDLVRNLATVEIEGADSTANCIAALTATTLVSPMRKISTEWNANWSWPKRIAEPKRLTTITFFGDVGTTSCAPTGASTALICGKKIEETGDDTGATGLTVTPLAGTARSWNYTYDIYGRPITVQDPLTNTTTYDYYPNTAAQNTQNANSRGMLRSITNAKNLLSIFMAMYDANGRMRLMTDRNNTGYGLTYWPRGWIRGKTANGELTQFEYDGVGQLTKVTLPDYLSVINYGYDAAHRLIKISDGATIDAGNRIVYTLDNMGNQVEEIAYDSSGNLAGKSKSEFDSLSRLAKKYYGAQSDVTTPYLYYTTLGYDANGNQNAITDATGRVTSQDYDALNRLSKVTVGGNITEYEYDAQGSLTKVTEPATPVSTGSSTTRRLATTYIYNGFGELKRQTSPDTGIADFTYDAAGNIKTRKDARPICATYDYDALNRVTAIKYAATCNPTTPDETVSYTYDTDDNPNTCTNGYGRLCRITDKTGNTQYAYDMVGRITSKAVTIGTLTQTVAYRYNGAGQLDQITYASGKKVGYAYTNNRVTGVTLDGATVLNNVVYRPFGPVSEWSWGNSTTGAPKKNIRTYDMDSRIKRVDFSVSSQSGNYYRSSQEYWYNNLSLISRIGLDLLLPGPGNGPTVDFTYADPFDRLTAQTRVGPVDAQDQSFTYDAVGNRRTHTVGAATTSYAYAANSNFLQGLSGSTTKTFTPDSVGNRTADGTNTWSYGKDNRPYQVSKVVAGSTLTTSFDINALGQRVRKTAPDGSAIRFLYDEAGHLIGEYNSAGALIREHLWLNDIPVGVVQ